MRNYLLLILSVIVFSCTKNDSANHNPSTLTEVNYKDISYGTDAQQKMDIYLPAGRTTTNTKVLVLIHGGGWTAGDKADFNSMMDSLKKRLPGYAIFNLNYRLGNWGVNLFPTQENDVNTAINFIYNKRNEYNISTLWVYAGASAGGHLALLQAYKNNTLIKPKAVINYYGPTDIDSLLANSNADIITKLLYNGLFNGTNAASSPARFVNAQTPPTITLQGKDDGLVPPSLQIYLHAKLKENNVPESLLLYEHEGHGFSAATMSKSYDAIVAFLKLYVK